MWNKLFRLAIVIAHIFPIATIKTVIYQLDILENSEFNKKIVYLYSDVFINHPETKEQANWAYDIHNQLGNDVQILFEGASNPPFLAQYAKKPVDNQMISFDTISEKPESCFINQEFKSIREIVNELFFTDDLRRLEQKNSFLAEIYNNKEFTNKSFGETYDPRWLIKEFFEILIQATESDCISISQLMNKYKQWMNIPTKDLFLPIIDCCDIYIARIKSILDEDIENSLWCKQVHYLKNLLNDFKKSLSLMNNCFQRRISEHNMQDAFGIIGLAHLFKKLKPSNPSSNSEQKFLFCFARSLYVDCFGDKGQMLPFYYHKLGRPHSSESCILFESSLIYRIINSRKSKIIVYANGERQEKVKKFLELFDYQCIHSSGEKKINKDYILKLGQNALSKTILEFGGIHASILVDRLSFQIEPEIQETSLNEARYSSFITHFIKNFKFSDDIQVITKQEFEYPKASIRALKKLPNRSILSHVEQKDQRSA